MTRSARLIRAKGPSNGSRGLVASPWILIDALLWAAMLIVALWMRYDFSIDLLAQSLRSNRFYSLLFGLIAVSSISGWATGLYRGRFFPGSLLETSALTVVFGGVTTVAFLVHIVAGNADGVPRSTPIITGAFTILASIVLRSVARRKELFGAGLTKNREAALVFGAGDGGSQLVRQLRRSKVSEFNPVGVLDDDPAKKNMLIDGVRVLGGRDSLEELAESTGASTLIIAVPSLPGDALVEIRNRAETAGLHVLVLPPLGALPDPECVAGVRR